MLIRQFRPADAQDVIALWRACDLVKPQNDPWRDVERKLSDSPWGFLVAQDEEHIVGSVMAGYDGHRGWINYLACSPARRRQGVGTALMGRATALLRERGCAKVNLQVREGNDTVIGFYRAIGYTQDAVVSLGMRLQRDDN